ncbi:MAG: hydrolase, TatD family, TatD DNase family protein [Candidatus Moranbacteria bacterium GW2011_GWC1_45_18]|nr:MAG: Hydrolase, TatD family [Candidatus Moranbacteria bacterium GW2011_GWC2_40_12]KKT32260.1 MAG: Hydrolase, TatD family [Candidatus Moranbacteria bacterium GW2011_GWF2_44_10]KKT70396.1 MAG: Hydrolase, TatD family [Candidatus Moranbacteria bacterium GW2011_GWF1_44_4]KKT99006.1 MAG: hydrolase, TatD family, TatD DNase family protein [Candidatus Moranbacteria bacterium GW2011_GWC1_45_18]OGI23236.1 MAG: hypothetical protein A2194_03100 [Candidatus Moranbacteria bacterium RIFOXYA1_FULL_44_8]OGI3
MIDTHSHLDFPELDEDREEVISRFFESGGKAIINVGVDLARSRKSIEIAKEHKNIFSSAGIHPDFFSQGLTFPSASLAGFSRPNLFLELKKIAKHEKVVAIGETGLDYCRIRYSIQHKTQKELEKIRENQKAGFIEQIKIARELDLPVIVHCREAWEDLYEIISKFYQSSTLSSPDYSSEDSPELSFLKFVLHCYSGERKDTEKFLKLPNVHFSFSGNITYPKPAERAEKLSDAVREIPLDRIMLDSDSPFLAPQAMRGKRNEPIFIKYIVKKIAEIKKISEKEVETITDENAIRFFRIGENLKNLVN